MHEVIIRGGLEDGEVLRVKARLQAMGAERAGGDGEEAIDRAGEQPEIHGTNSGALCAACKAFPNARVTCA